jgi:Domain of Unknown Function with PDB structure (DUF3857)/Transglutaminase-like superfamily
MQKIIIVLILWGLNSPYALAQKAKKVKKESEIVFGKIAPEDLKMTIYPLDSSAQAVVLATKGEISIESSYDEGLQVHFRKYRCVKLFKKAIFNQEGNIDIVYLNDSRNKYLKNLKAAVIQPDGTRRELTKKDFVEEKNFADIRSKKFVFPDLTEGCIIEYEYELTTNNLVSLHDWEFQAGIPVRHSEIWLKLPKNFEYTFLFRGRQNLKRDTIGVEKMFADSVPALRKEGFITTMEDYMSQINFQLFRINHTDGETEDIMSNWKKVAEKFEKNQYIGSQIKIKENYNEVWKVVKPLLENAKTDEAKMKIIYNYLNSNVKWDDDRFDFTADESLNAAFKKKKANSGELNMMMLACLSEAGIKAYPILISTRGHRKPIVEYPILSQFNHLACYIDKGEKSFLIDLGNPNRPIGLPNIESLNGKGWIMDKDSQRWVNIVAPLSNEVSFANFKLNKEGTFIGSFSNSYGGYAAVKERENETEKSDDDKDFKEKLKKDFPDIRIDSFSTTNFEKVAEPLKRVVHCTIPNAATLVDNYMYIKPALKTEFDQNPFSQPKRDYPIDFSNPLKDHFVLNLTIPEGYTVEDLPKSIRMKLPNDGGTFQYVSEVKGNMIQLEIKIQISQLHFEPEEYKTVQDFFNLIASKSAEQVVLKKKDK